MKEFDVLRSVKNEDWGPGGINQKNNPKPKAKAKK
jgi:hypothetical protein